MNRILGALLALSLLAFGSAQEPVTIGVSIPAATHGWTGGVNWWAERTAAELEARYPSLDFIVNTASDPGEQANDLQDMVAIDGIDALVILPFESDPLTAPVAQVKEQGVLITVVDRGLIDPSIQDIYVAGNNPEMGRVSCEYIAERLGGEGNIVVLRGIPTVIDNQRVEGCMEVLEETNIEVLAMEYANWNRDDGFEVMQDFLSRFDDIDAVWAQDDDIAVGVIAALEQAGRTDEMFIVGGAGMKEMIKRVMDGDELVPVDVLYPPSMIATAMEVTALYYVSDVPVLGEFILGATLVTQENAEQYYFPDAAF
jgi:ribose transport system substrate-binding protein